MMLIDKSYYDYDYEQHKRKHKGEVKTKTKEEMNAILSRFGFRTTLRTSGDSGQSKLTPDEMQRIAMEELKEKKAND